MANAHDDDCFKNIKTQFISIKYWMAVYHIYNLIMIKLYDEKNKIYSILCLYDDIPS